MKVVLFSITQEDINANNVFFMTNMIIRNLKIDT